jgi:ketosteroid isomerase-like protein
MDCPGREPTVEPPGSRSEEPASMGERGEPADAAEGAERTRSADHRRPADDVGSTIERMYDAFNRRDVDRVLECLTPDVAWANGMEGGHVHGVEAVRSYWSRQFELIRSTVDPLAVRRDGEGRAVVDVHQVVRDAATDALVSETDVIHVFTFRGDRIARFDLTRR